MSKGILFRTSSLAKDMLFLEICLAKGIIFVEIGLAEGIIVLQIGLAKGVCLHVNLGCYVPSNRVKASNTSQIFICWLKLRFIIH